MPGFQTPTVLVLLCELGPAFAGKFPTAKHCGGWLGLCPDNRITGGRIYSVRPRDVKSRVAEALRLAAQSLGRAQNYFGELYRRWKARPGSPKAITAMAHKLARILWPLLKFKEPFNPEVFAHEEEQLQRKKIARLPQLSPHSHPITYTSSLSGGHNLHILDVENKHCILRDARKLLVTVTQMRAGSESARASGAHPLQAITKTGDSLPVSNRPNLFSVSRKKVSVIELNVVAKAHPVALLQLRACSGYLFNNLDA